MDSFELVSRDIPEYGATNLASKPYIATPAKYAR